MNVHYKYSLQSDVLFRIAAAKDHNMGFAMCFQTLFAILLIALRVAADTSSVNLTTTVEDALLGSTDMPDVVNQSEVVTVPFPHALSNASSRHPLFARQSNLYSVTYSRRALNFSSNLTVFALPVPASDVRSTLETAINHAGEHSASELQSHFISSASNLSVIMNSINETVDDNSFNWQDFSSVASILLRAVTQHPNLNRTLVGIVKDPSGNPIVQVAILPEYVVIGSDGKPSLLNMDPSLSSTTTAETAPSDLPKRARAPDRVRIPGTTYTTNFALTPGTAHGVFLRTIMAWAINMVTLDPGRKTRYSAMVAESFAHTVQAVVAGANMRTNFTFRCADIVRLRHHELLAVLERIYYLVDIQVRSTALAPNPELWSWSGEIFDQLGNVIARWTLGEPNRELGCSTLTAQQDGSAIHGCLFT